MAVTGGGSPRRGDPHRAPKPPTPLPQPSEPPITSPRRGDPKPSTPLAQPSEPPIISSDSLTSIVPSTIRSPDPFTLSHSQSTYHSPSPDPQTTYHSPLPHSSPDPPPLQTRHPPDPILQTPPHAILQTRHPPDPPPPDPPPDERDQDLVEPREASETSSEWKSGDAKETGEGRTSANHTRQHRRRRRTVQLARSSGEGGVKEPEAIVVTAHTEMQSQLFRAFLVSQGTRSNVGCKRSSVSTKMIDPDPDPNVRIKGEPGPEPDPNPKEKEKDRTTMFFLLCQLIGKHDFVANFLDFSERTGQVIRARLDTKLQCWDPKLKCECAGCQSVDSGVGSIVGWVVLEKMEYSRVSVNSLAFLPRVDTLVTGDNEGGVNNWDAQSRKKLYEFQKIGDVERVFDELLLKINVSFSSMKSVNVLGEASHKFQDAVEAVKRLRKDPRDDSQYLLPLVISVESGFPAGSIWDGDPVVTFNDCADETDRTSDEMPHESMLFLDIQRFCTHFNHWLERKDVMTNAPIYKAQVSALEAHATVNCKVLIVANATNNFFESMTMQVMESDVVTTNMLLSSWVRVKMIDYARKVFDERPLQCLVSFSALIQVIIRVTAIYIVDRGGSKEHKVRNHEVSDELIEELKGALEEFFKLPLKENEVVAPLPGGLQGYGQNLVINEEKLEWQDMMLLITQPLHARNFTFWVYFPSNFRSTLDKYFTEFQSVSRWLFDVMAKSLELNPEVLCGIFKDHQRMGMNYYPPGIKANQVLDTNPISQMAEKENMLRVISAYGFERSSAIQQWGIVSLIKGLVVIHQVQAEIGGTATFGSNTLQQLDYGQVEYQAWVPTPTRKLTQQTYNVMRALDDYLVGKVHARVGGANVRKDYRIRSTSFSSNVLFFTLRTRCVFGRGVMLGPGRFTYLRREKGNKGKECEAVRADSC